MRKLKGQLIHVQILYLPQVFRINYMVMGYLKEHL